MRTYYDFFNLKPNATPIEVEASFRRFLARYRPTIEAETLFADARFRTYLNAYLTLRGPLRTRYDEILAASAEKNVALPAPLEDLSLLERRLLMARAAYLRRETVSAIHLLRTTLEKEPGYAPGWALMGEVYFTIDRIEEGIQAYQRAVAADEKNTVYATRLQHARDALAGKVELKIEESPEEELRREERRKRWRVTACILLIGLACLAAAFVLRLEPDAGLLYLPVRSVLLQAGGVFILMLALAFGRLMPSFERHMVWSGMAAGDRGRMRQYPYGLIFIVTAVPSMWASLLALIVMAFMDEQWPTPQSIMIGLCVLLNAGLTAMMYVLHHDHWTGTLFMGGNALVLAAMLGWWIGSFGSPSYD